MINPEKNLQITNSPGSPGGAAYYDPNDPTNPNSIRNLLASALSNYSQDGKPLQPKTVSFSNGSSPPLPAMAPQQQDPLMQMQQQQFATPMSPMEGLGIAAKSGWDAYLKNQKLFGTGLFGIGNAGAPTSAGTGGMENFA